MTCMIKGLCKIHCSTFPMTRKKNLKSVFSLQMVKGFCIPSGVQIFWIFSPTTTGFSFLIFSAAISFEIVRAGVHIWVMVYTAVNISTLAFKPSKSHFLPAHETKILFLFWLFKRLGFALQTAAMPFLILKFAGLLFSVLLCPKMYCPLGKTPQILIKVTAVIQGLAT